MNRQRLGKAMLIVAGLYAALGTMAYIVLVALRLFGQEAVGYAGLAVVITGLVTWFVYVQLEHNAKMEAIRRGNPF